MQTHDLPSHFWIVTQPVQGSTLTDICFRCDFERIFNQVRGGLKEDDVVGFYRSEGQAIVTALELLKPFGELRIEDADKARYHPTPWCDWYPAQDSIRGVWIISRATGQKLKVEPPVEWGSYWMWKVFDEAGVVFHRTET